MKPIRLSLVICSLMALPLTGCLNIFSPLSKPGGDAQILADARACFDKGDTDCALRNYQALSSDMAAISASEQVYLAISQQGANMSAYMEFVGNGTGGIALTKFAERLVSGAGLAKRTAIYNAFATTAYATAAASRTDLQNFTVFVSSLALAAEILAETAGADGIVRRSGLVANQASCTGAGGANCDGAASNLQVTSTGGISSATSGAQPTADQLFYSIQYAYNAINQLGASGSFQGSNGLGTVLSGGAPGGVSAVDRVFRGQLLSYGVGE